METFKQGIVFLQDGEILKFSIQVSQNLSLIYLMYEFRLIIVISCYKYSG